MKKVFATCANVSSGVVKNTCRLPWGWSDNLHLVSTYRMRRAVPTSSPSPSATIVFIIADSLYAPHVYVMQAPELSIRREKTEQRWCVKQKK